MIDRNSVFSTLDTDRVCARCLKKHLRSEYADSPAVILPSPTAEPASGTVFKIDLRSGGRTNSIDWTAAAVDAIRKLHPDRIVCPGVVLRFGSNPQTVWPARFGREYHVEIVRRIDRRRSYFRHAGVGMMNADAGCGGGIIDRSPTAGSYRRLSCVKHDFRSR